MVMKAYHVYADYGQYTDRYGTEEYGYFMSKPKAEKYKDDLNSKAVGYFHAYCEEIEVDETP